MAGSLDHDLAVLITEIHANVSHAESLTAGLSHQQFNWRPEPRVWSVGQNLAHLNTVNSLDVAPLRVAIESGQTRNITGEGPFVYGFLSRKFVASLEPLGASQAAARKFKAPKQYEPPLENNVNETLAEYRRISGELRELMYSAAGLHLVRVKTRLPALPRWLRPIYKIPLGARFAVLAAHDRRHLSQAEQIRYREDFPA
jgi:hypothetical protein